jgi:hypothetical protein
MKMKNFITPFAALLIIGLLVITGCQGLFEPPAKPAGSGIGTLFVTVNGAGGRTILPEASLDKYVLQVYTGAGFTEPVGEPQEVSGTVGIGLSAGSYKVVVNGFLSDAKVASGEANATLSEGAVQNVSVTLTPLAAGDGTFTWDLTDLEDENSIEVDVRTLDSPGATNLITGGDAFTGSAVLATGVYQVTFTLKDTEDDTVLAKWIEVLYIYPGLTSSYNGADIIANAGRFATYEVPDDGEGYFYLNLNNWDTPWTGGTGTPFLGVIEEGTLATGSLTALFTRNNEFLNIKLTEEQQALIKTAKFIYVTVDATATRVDEDGNQVYKVDGDGEPTSDPENPGNFRFFLVDPTQGGSFNATGSGYDGAFSGIVGAQRRTEFNSNRTNNPNTLNYFGLQHRTADVRTKVVINSIKIEYPLGYVTPTDAPENSFYLDLDDWYKLSSQGAGRVTAVFDSDTNSYTFNYPATGNNRLSIGLSDAQKGILATTAGATTTLNVISPVEMIIEGSTAITGNFRALIGTPDAGSSWNATNTNLWLDAENPTGGASITVAGNNLIKTPGETLGTYGWSGNITPATLSYFILQNNPNNDATAGPVTISSILIKYTPKPPPQPCACPGCAANGKKIDEAKAAWLWCTCADHPAAPCDECEVCAVVGPIPFDIDAVEGGITLGVAGDNLPVWDAESKVVTVTASSSSAFYIPAEALAGVDLTAAVEVTYVALMWPEGDKKAHVILKKNTSWGDTNNGGTYPQLEMATVTTEDDELVVTPKTLTIAAGKLDSDSVILFQHNNNDNASASTKYQVKILSVSN